MSSRPPLFSLAAAILLALAMSACERTPPPAAYEPVPPPRRPLDAKTQLEYVSPPPTVPRY